MSAKAISTRKLSKEEIEKVNSKIIEIGPKLRLFGGSITKYDDDTCEATFASEYEYGAKVNAEKIGALMLKLFDYVDRVNHDGRIVACR